ncbi:MAG: transglycosylase SLT domain-containing protein [Muribaculaceae bacterium]|nr:transglycosylase SLT domain-containing protein [Muribaculaceae bacterium]
MRRLKMILILATVALTIVAAPRERKNILSIKESITDNDIVFPESFETDTRELMKNWYLQNYTVLDTDVENRSTGEVSEDEYIKRLKAMPTIIEMPYNQVVRSYIDRYVKRNRTLVEEMLGMSLYYMPIFEQALERENLPLELKYLPVIESALDPNAVSRAGAAGLWQFMVGTGKGLGLEINSLVDERRDPYKSSEKAATYLKNLHSIYNDWSLAIAAYNCGPGNVNKALRRAGGENKDFWEIYSYLPRETRGYVPAFIAANYIMTYFKRHNISPSLASKPLITDTVGVSRRINFNQISNVLNIPLDEIRALNPQYRHDIIPGTSERSYTLVLPSQQVYSYIMSEDSISNYRNDLYAQREVVEPVGASQNVSSSNSNVEYTYENKTVTEYHKIRRGETYSSIASHYGMSLNSLLSLNGLKNGKARRGQVVKVQTTKKVRVAKPASYVSDDDDIRVVHGDDYSLDQNDYESSTEEQEQIEEVRQIEKAAASSRHIQKVDVPPAKPQPKAAPQHTADSKQMHQRNSRHADHNASRKTSREENYKNTRSSGKRGDKRHHKQVAEQPAKPTEHTIKKGETLSEISERTGVSVKELKAANGIKNDDNIKAGDNLKIPSKGGKTSKAAAKTSSKGSKATTKSSKGSKASKGSSKSSGKSTSSGKKSRRKK